MEGVSESSGKPGTVRVERTSGGTAVIRLGAPDERVVTLTRERMLSLREALGTVKSSPPRALIVTGPGRDMFTAGADINILRDVKDPAVGRDLALEGQRIFDELDSLPFPTVAAISGPCVGGGCEMALACDYRIISDDKSSLIGLPEVSLGILPGFGGTQRMPRLVGAPKALDLILNGKTLRPNQARTAGLVDEIVTFDRLLERAESLATSTSDRRSSRLTARDRFLTFNKIGRWILRRMVEPKLAHQTKGFYPAPPSALNAVFLGLEEGMAQGLHFEANELGRLVVTPECKSLVRIFFLREGAKGLGKAGRKATEHLRAVVVGAGTMGAGIAGILAKSECSVILKDTSSDAVDRGMKHVRGYVQGLKYLGETEKSFILNRIEPTTADPATLGNANFAVEAIFEDLELKKKVFRHLSSLMPPDALLATNTSSLSVTEIASAIENPGRVVGMHFFNPVEKMPLVEIVRGKQTEDKTIVIIAALATKLGKFPIVVNDVPGFLVNRILSPYMNEAAFMLSEGYDPEEIDRAATRFGLPMGPMRLLDEVGLDVAAHVSDIMVAGYGERMKGPGIAKALVAAGRKGKKTDAGIFDYKNGKAVPTPKLREMLGISASPGRSGGSKDLQDRLSMSLLNEGIRCLDEGVAGLPGPEAADQIDLGTVMGFGFPPFRGGLVHHADALGAQSVLATLERLEKTYGARFAPWKGIVERARSGKRFREAIDRGVTNG